MWTEKQNNEALEIGKEALEKLGELVRVHNSWIGDDGWLDGYKVLYAVIETPREELFKIKQGGSLQSAARWYKLTQGGGWALVDADDLVRPYRSQLGLSEDGRMANGLGKYIRNGG